MVLEKYSGAKNVFLICESAKLDEPALKRLAKQVCDPYRGFFADGAVFVEPLGGNNFKWNFFNSDGSSAEMCGNAVRCVHAFIKKKVSSDLNSISLQTLSGTVFSEFKEDSFHVRLNPPSKTNDLVLAREFFSSNESYGEFGSAASYEVFFADTGVPHVVVPVNNWDKAIGLTSTWLFIRNHPYFSKGTNVTLVQSQANGTAKAISFERGVDNFTQACGTGAVAAGIFIGKSEKLKFVSILMPGGDLKVDLTSASPILIGQAQYVGSVTTEFKE